MRLSPFGLKASLLGDGDSARGLGSGSALSGAPATDAVVSPQAAPQDRSQGQGCSGAGGGPAARSLNQKGGRPRPPGHPFLEAFGCAFPWEMRTYRKKKLTKTPALHCRAAALCRRSRSQAVGTSAPGPEPGNRVPAPRQGGEGPEGQGRLHRLHFLPGCVHPRGRGYLIPAPLPESPSSSFPLLLPQKGPASSTVHPLPAPQVPRTTGAEGATWSPRPHLSDQQGPQAPGRDLTRPASPGGAPSRSGAEPGWAGCCRRLWGGAAGPQRHMWGQPDSPLPSFLRALCPPPCREEALPQPLAGPEPRLCEGCPLLLVWGTSPTLGASAGQLQVGWALQGSCILASAACSPPRPLPGSVVTWPPARGQPWEAGSGSPAGSHGGRKMPPDPGRLCWRLPLGPSQGSRGVGTSSP